MDVAALRASQATPPSEPYIYFTTQVGNAIHRVTLAGDNLTKVIDLEAAPGEEGYASHGIAISASTNQSAPDQIPRHTGLQMCLQESLP